MPAAGPSGGGPGTAAGQRRVGRRTTKSAKRVPYHVPRPDTSKARPIPVQTKGVAKSLSRSYVSPHLVQHRANVARQAAQRQGARAQRQGQNVTGVPATPSRHLVEHRQNRAAKQARRAQRQGLNVTGVPKPPTRHLLEHRRNRAALARMGAQQAGLNVTGVPAAPTHLAQHRANVAQRAQGERAAALAIESPSSRLDRAYAQLKPSHVKVPTRDLISRAAGLAPLGNPLVNIIGMLQDPKHVGPEVSKNLSGIFTGKPGRAERLVSSTVADSADWIKRNFSTPGLQKFNPTEPTKVTTQGIGPDPTEFATNALKDAADLAAGIVPSVYLPARDIAQGNPEAALKKVVAPFKELAKDPGRFAYEHPVSTYFMARGGGALVGRAGGGLARGIGRAGAAHSDVAAAIGRAGSTYRGTAELRGTNVRIQRSYSPDIIEKGFQVLAEKYGVQAERAKVKRTQAKIADSRGKHAEARALRTEAADIEAKAKASHVSEKEIRDTLNAYHYGTQHTTRGHRGEVLRDVQRAVKKAGKSKGALVTTAQQITRADATDIAHYITELEREMADHPDMTPDMRNSNFELRQQLSKALESGIKPEKLRAAVGDLQDILLPREAALVERGMLDPRQAEKRRLTPAAVRRLGSELGTVRNRSAAAVTTVMKAKTREEGKLREAVSASDETAAALSVRHLDAIDKTLAQLGEEVGPDYRGQVVGGEALTLAEMRAQLRPHLETEPVMVTQRPRLKASSGKYVGYFPRKGIGGKVFTGAATKLGTFSGHPDILSNQAARMQGLLDADKAFEGFANLFGYRSRGGDNPRQIDTFKSKEDAQAKADQLNAASLPSGQSVLRPGAIKWRAINLKPLSGRHEMVDKLIKGTEDDPEIAGLKPVRDALVEGVRGEGKGDTWALVPETAAKTLEEHYNLTGERNWMRAWHHVNSAFRKAVLASNPRWLYGNVGEGLLRTAVQHGLNPVSVVHSALFIRKVKKTMLDPPEARAAEAAGHAHEAAILRDKGQQAYDELANHGWGGGIYEMASFSGGMHSPLERFDEGTLPRWVAERFQQVGDTPIGLLPKAWNFYTTTVFSKVNGALERGMQRTMAGKGARDLVRAQRDAARFTKGQTGRLMGTAVEQAARGLTETPEQIQLGRVVMRAYGQYHGWSPNARKLIEDYTPFVAWSWNAFRFLTSVLPRDHPVLTGLLSAAFVSSEDWRKKHGLSWFVGKGALPPFLQGTIPTDKGAHANPGRFTPFSFGANPLETLSGNVLPQINSPLLALAGLDWKGKPLRGNYYGARLAEAATSLAESTIPGGPQIAQIAGGKKPSELFWPIIPVYAASKKKGRKAAAPSKPGTYNFAPAAGGSSGSTGSYNFAP